jgi:chromosome segregation ATPase
MVQTLDRQDQEVVYMVCDLLSQEKFVSSFVPRMVQDRRGDNEFAEYWQEPSRIQEITRLASSCMRQLRQIVRFETAPQGSSTAQAGSTTSDAANAPPASPERVRLAQTMLAEMGLYRSSIDGAMGPGTRRALQDAMRQFGSSEEPTIENFIAEAEKKQPTLSSSSSIARTSQDLRVCEASKLSIGTRLMECSTKLSTSVVLSRNLAAEVDKLRSESLSSVTPGSSASEEELSSLVVAQQLEIEALKKQLAAAPAAGSGNAPQESRGNETELRAELDETKRQLEAANKTIADIQAGSVSSTALAEEQAQRQALGSSLAELQDRLEKAQGEIASQVAALDQLSSERAALAAENANLQNIVVGLNKTISDLQSGMEADARLSELRKQLDAANSTIASMQEGSVPVATHRELEQQRDALSKALADAKEATEANFIAREEHVAALAAMQDSELNLRRQLDGVNKSLVDLQDNISRNYVSLDEHKLKIATLAEAEASLRRQLDAANTTVADLQNKIEIGYVPIASHNETLAQLDALNARIVDLQNTMERDYTPNAKMVEALRLIDAANSTIADLQASIAAEYKPLQDFQQLERQISALNTTILELQERNEVQRNRMLESEALFRNFRDDCAASDDCKKAMRLE